MPKYRVRVRGSIIIPAKNEREAWQKVSEIMHHPDFSLEHFEKYSLCPYGHIDFIPDYEANLIHKEEEAA